MFATITPVWLLHNFFFHLSTVASGAFVDLFLWQQTQSLRTILIYNLGAFITLPLMAFIIAWLIEYIGPKISYLLAIFFSISFVLVLIFTQDLIVAQPFLLGLIKGVSLGSLLTVADFLQTKLSRTEADIGRFSSISSLVKVAMPPVLAFIALSYNSFGLIFRLGLISLIILSIFTILAPFPSTDFKFNLKAALLPTRKTNPEKPILAKAHFLMGIKDGFFFSLLNIIIFFLVGGLRGWGIFTFALGAFSFLLGIIYQYLFDQEQSLVLLAFGAVAFTAGSIAFASQFNLTGLILFATTYTLLNTTFSLTINPINSQISSLDSLNEDLVVEYGIFSQIYQSFGRLIPILVLIFLNVSLKDPGALEGVIFAISLVPFTIISVLRHSLALRHAGDMQSVEEK